MASIRRLGYVIVWNISLFCASDGAAVSSSEREKVFHVSRSSEDSRHHADRGNVVSKGRWRGDIGKVITDESYPAI